MDDSETLQLAQEFELVGVAEPGAELKGMNWIHVQSNFIGKIFVCVKGVRAQRQGRRRNNRGSLAHGRH